LACPGETKENTWFHWIKISRGKEVAAVEHPGREPDSTPVRFPEPTPDEHPKGTRFNRAGAVNWTGIK